MANKGGVKFIVSFFGDGVSNTWVSDTATGPYVLISPLTNGEIASTFSLASNAPTGFNSLTVDGGLSVTATILLGVVTYTFTGGPPASGTQYNITGFFEF